MQIGIDCNKALFIDRQASQAGPHWCRSGRTPKRFIHRQGLAIGGDQPVSGDLGDAEISHPVDAMSFQRRGHSALHGRPISGQERGARLHQRQF